MKRNVIFLVALVLILTGCQFIESPLKQIPSTFGTSFEIDTTKNENEYWMNTANLVIDAFDTYDLLSEKGNEIDILLSSVTTSWDMTDGERKRNVITKYIIRDDTYELVGTQFQDPSANIPETFALVLQGKNLLEKPMCFGAEGPIQNIGLVNEKIAVTYVEGTCTYNGEKEQNSTLNIFYDGQTMNERYGVEGSHYLFVYKDKIGFIAREGEKEYIYFNGKKVSEAFDSIPSHGCCMSISPLLMLSENGAFLFRGSKENNYYLTEIDLNKYL